MITAQEFIDEAETWIGTKFMHQGRVKGAGVDCYGLVIEVARYFNLTNFKSSTYGRQPKADVMWAALRTHMIEVDKENLIPGTILFIAFERDPQHLAIFDGKNIIHAYAFARKVVKHRFDSQWKARVRGAFQFRGVQY